MLKKLVKIGEENVFKNCSKLEQVRDCPWKQKKDRF